MNCFRYRAIASLFAQTFQTCKNPIHEQRLLLLDTRHIILMVLPNILNLFDEEEIIDIGITTAKKSSALPRDTAMTSYSTRCGHTYRIVPESTDVAVWGIEADIMAGTITELVCNSFEEYIPK